MSSLQKKIFFLFQNQPTYGEWCKASTIKTEILRKIEILKNQQLLSYQHLYIFVIKFAKPILKKINVKKMNELGIKITNFTSRIFNFSIFNIPYRVTIKNDCNCTEFIPCIRHGLTFYFFGKSINFYILRVYSLILCG